MTPQPAVTRSATTADPLEAWLVEVHAAAARRRAERSGLRWWLTRPLRVPRVIRRRIRQDGFFPTMVLLTEVPVQLLRRAGGRLRRVLPR